MPKMFESKKLRNKVPGHLMTKLLEKCRTSSTHKKLSPPTHPSIHQSNNQIFPLEKQVNKLIIADSVLLSLFMRE